jgi:hypothetical protein
MKKLYLKYHWHRLRAWYLNTSYAIRRCCFPKDWRDTYSPNESRKSVVARLNKKSWPCSDRPLFYPPMRIVEREKEH